MGGCIGKDLPHCRNFEDIPFHGRVELGQIHAHLDHVGAIQFVDVPQIHLQIEFETKILRQNVLKTGYLMHWEKLLYIICIYISQINFNICSFLK